MEEEFKTFLAKKGISVDEYKGGSLEAKAKLVETFEKSKPQGKLSIHYVLLWSTISLSLLIVSCCALFCRVLNFVSSDLFFSFDFLFDCSDDFLFFI